MGDFNIWHVAYEFRSVIYTLVAIIALSRILKKFFKTLRKAR